MSKLTEFQIYAAIKSCEATARKHDAAGKPKLSAACRQREFEYRQELTERLAGLVRNGGQVPAGLQEYHSQGVA